METTKTTQNDQNNNYENKNKNRYATKTINNYTNKQTLPKQRQTHGCKNNYQQLQIKKNN